MKVRINGGDITGLVVARIMRAAGHHARVFERSIPGASALLPRFKYLERSKEVTRFLDGLGVLYGEYSIASGVMLHGKVVPCRENLTQSVQHAHWKKTRMTSPAPGEEVKGVTDPEVGPKRKAVSLDWGDLRKPLLRDVTIEADAKDAFDLTVETRPMWEFAEGSDAMAATLNLVPVKAVGEGFIRWDLVYTPFTPADCIHRFYHHAGGYICECSGQIDEDRLTSDLNFLFPRGWHVDGEIQIAHGHLLPLEHRPSVPPGVHRIGRLAQWDEGVTMTNVIREAMKIAWNANP